MVTIDKSLELVQKRTLEVNLDPFWSPLLESLHRGFVIVSHDRHLIYANSKAKVLYSSLLDPEETLTVLPIAISEACSRFGQEPESKNDLLVMEQVGHAGQTIRSRISWLKEFETAGVRSDRSYILVSVENCDETLQENLWIDQKRYNLTDREAEVWSLLQRDYSYQDMTKVLKISLNTVKTHVKHIHAKRRSCHAVQLTPWYSR